MPSIIPTVETSSAPPQAPPAKSKFSTVLAMLTPKLTNKKFISIAYGSITGSWKIDTSLVLPRFLRGSEAWNEQPETWPNIRLGTIYGAIEIDLTILREYDLDQRERVSIELATEYGPIKCAILDRADKSIDLRISSTSGQIEIRLPINFCGSVTCYSQKRRVTFSEDVQARLSNSAALMNTISGTGTISPPPDNKDVVGGDGARQFNDSLHFSNVNGPVFVSFHQPVGSSKKGLFNFFSSGGFEDH